MDRGAKGRVYLVGAGPGDPGLITFRAMELLAAADAVCYDALIDPTLIATLPWEIERHYVGKRAGSHSRSQGEIEELLIKLANEGKRVVRLKGGDPYVFGRGGEEALALKKAGVACEVVPGVTAATAATAFAGIPLTHRGVSSFAVLFTAHEASDGHVDDKLPLDKFAQLPGGTLVGYMGVGRLAYIRDTLIESGMKGGTPAAVIERGTTAAQKTVRGSLADLPELAERAGVRPPALIVIGGVADLAETLGMAGPGVLAGIRVLVTRPAMFAGRFYDLLRIYGAVVVPVPSIRSEKKFDESAWTSFREISSTGGWIVFTSEIGVRTFFELLPFADCDLRALGRFRIAALGRGTAAAIQAQGFKPDFVPGVSYTNALAEELPSSIENDAAVVRVRGNLADDKVEKALESAGAKVFPLEIYKTLTAEVDDGMRAWVNEAPIDIVTFTSGSTVRGFFEQWGPEAVKILADAKVASIGPMTSAVLRERGLEVTVEAKRYDVDGLVEAIVSWASDR